MTKQICLIDAPPYHADSELIPDYALGDDMILVKGYCDFSTSYTESEIRTEISETLQHKFPLITLTFFDFVKRERNTIVMPVVKSSHRWDFQQVKELCGQVKLYVRLNVDAEALEISEDGEAEENIDTTVNQPERNSTTPRNNSSNSTFGASTSCSSQRNSTDVHVIAINSESPCPSDSLQEMLPNSSVEAITNTLSSCEGDINSTLDSLLDKESKVKCRPAKLTVDQDDIFNDAIAFYKDVAFDPEVPLRINFVDQPAIDGGGLLRQFFTDLYSCLTQGKPVPLFLGEFGRMCPTHSPQVVFSGLIDIVGKVIAHSLVQGGPGFPFLSLPCYYLATGEVINSMAYCDPWDIPDTVNR